MAEETKNGRNSKCNLKVEPTRLARRLGDVSTENEVIEDDSNFGLSNWRDRDGKLSK